MQECDQDKEDPTNKLEQSEEIIQERELTLEDKCRLIVDDIRREEFGVGIKLDEAGQNLMQVWFYCYVHVYTQPTILYTKYACISTLSYQHFMN